jgi:hypothetical protein
MAPTVTAATRDQVLERAVRVADRLADVQEIGQRWRDAPYLVGCALLWEQLPAQHPARGRLWQRVDERTARGFAVVTHGDQTAFAQAAMDLARLAPPDADAFRRDKLAVTDSSLAFVERALRVDARGADPVDGWWVASGYGCRFWQDDLFMVLPWLAMRGSSGSGLPCETTARDLAYEWLEAHAFDHRKSLNGASDGDVPSRHCRRRSGWDRAEPITGRLLYDPLSGLWWHDPGDVGSSEYWCRGNGWVAAALARTQHFLDVPYGGSAFERVVDRAEMRRLLAHQAARLKIERNSYGTWNGDIVRRDRYPLAESSGSALIVYMLATGVAEGWLDEPTYGPVLAKAFHALTLLVDAEGDVHHIERSVDSPSPGPYLASDAHGVNLNYGPGAFLMASAAMARLEPWLAVMESTEAEVIPRARFAVDGDRLVIDVADLDLDLDGVEEVGAVSAQLFLDARIEGSFLSVANRANGPIVVFARWPAAQAQRWTEPVLLTR